MGYGMRVLRALAHPFGTFTHLSIGLLVLASAQSLPAVPPQQALATAPKFSSSEIFSSDRSYKIGQIDAYKEPIELLVFGGSRSQRFDAAYLTKATGLRAYNTGVHNGKPSDAWAFTSYCRAKNPDVTLYCLWSVHPSIRFQADFDPALVQDPRLSTLFPQEDMDEQEAKLRATLGIPRFIAWSPGTFGPDGTVTHNYYDFLESQGRTLDQAVQEYVGMMNSSGKTSTPRTRSVSLQEVYFMRTLGLFNSMGVAPVLVYMPTHPDAIAGIGTELWEGQNKRFREFLDRLKPYYDFVLLDYSHIASFGGDANQFYDGVHIKAENARRIVDSALEDAPNAFKPNSVAPRSDGVDITREEALAIIQGPTITLEDVARSALLPF